MSKKELFIAFKELYGNNDLRLDAILIDMFNFFEKDQLKEFFEFVKEEQE